MGATPVADAVFHMAVGMGAGALLGAPRLLSAWHRAAPLAGPIGRALIASYAVGFFAIVPNLLTTVGLPATIHHAWWSNLFVLHGLIDRREGGLLIGELGVAVQFVGQYLIILLAIRRARLRAATRPPAR